MRHSLLWSSLGGLIAVVVLILWRGHPWQLALFSGASIGVLIFFTLKTVTRLRDELGPRP